MKGRRSSPAALHRFARAWLVLMTVGVALVGIQLLLRIPGEQASAQRPTDLEAEAGTIRILPASTTVEVGEEVTVEVWLEDVGDYYGLDFRFSFDPNVVHVPAGEVTPLWEVFDEESHFPLLNEADNVSGTVQYALANLNPAEPFTGTGRVCAVIFSGVASGTTDLSFYYAKGSTRRGEGLFPTQVNGEIVVRSPAPPPIIGALDPPSVTAGSPGFTLTVHGANFIAESAVWWDGQPRPTTFVSTTRLLAALGTPDLAMARAVTVEVANAMEPEDRSNAVSFRILNPVPQISSLHPVSATAGGSPFVLSVGGANFVTGSAVHWLGEPRATAYVSSTQLTADITAEDLLSSGVVPIVVVNPAPGGGSSDAVPFEIAERQLSFVYLPLIARTAPAP